MVLTVTSLFKSLDSKVCHCCVLARKMNFDFKCSHNISFHTLSQSHSWLVQVVHPSPVCPGGSLKVESLPAYGFRPGRLGTSIIGRRSAGESPLAAGRAGCGRSARVPGPAGSRPPAWGAQARAAGRACLTRRHGRQYFFSPHKVIVRYRDRDRPAWNEWTRTWPITPIVQFLI